MVSERVVLSQEPLGCVHIGKEDIKAIEGFSIANKEGGFLADYLKKCALSDEEKGRSRTYLIYDMRTDEIVAYFALKAGFVSLNEARLSLKREFAEPGVELSNFAVNGAYVRKHPEAKGAGAGIFRSFILPTVYQAANIVGVRILYIFALPHKGLIEYYTTLGFVRLSKAQEDSIHRRIKPRYDRGCIFMYQVIRVGSYSTEKRGRARP